MISKRASYYRYISVFRLAFYLSRSPIFSAEKLDFTELWIPAIKTRLGSENFENIATVRAFIYERRI